MLLDGINLMKHSKQFTVFRYHCVNSTNDTARSLCNSIAKEKIVVISETQRKGKGRKNRQWTSNKGGLYLSLALIPPHKEKVPFLTFLTASAACQSLQKLFKIDPNIKWPNDIILNGKKLGGILAESIMGEKMVVVIGLGINLNQEKFPYELKNKTTSIFLETQKTCNQRKFEATFLNSFNKFYEKYCAREFSLLLKEWKKWDITTGARVTVKTVKGRKTGLVKGVTNEGSLLLKCENNILLELREGEVTIDQFTGKTFKK